MIKEHAVIFFAWLGWCTLHSLLISHSVISYMKYRFPRQYRYYRLGFNLVALFTLLPVIVYGQFVKSPVVFQWQGAPVILQVICVMAALFFFVAGGAKYDTKQFLGLAQIRSGDGNALLTESGKLDTSGILAVTRHPWYLGGILIIWTYQPKIDLQSLITNSVITLYFIIGAFLEERKLVKEFGSEYRDYQSKVSMLFPAKYLYGIFIK
jgi:protein-S-isoprenylcysteine O-methyltransferase Ste14